MELGAWHGGTWKCSGSLMGKLSEKGHKAILLGFCGGFIT